ncbi:hypothetical protein SAMN05443572_110242 [Myxococcus fulvus]|uniref:Uncharacterized protein n=1 Tax=Myxococcus fulvus TaxID=33 RepID=A0A511T9L4_MYXFU|nr:hypothetical protein MFUL124B02_14575 [Myxococcus fulvus 124B02]GEN10162.1 hypothetical protein MFU01_51990 [Myxococcus fulvus]SEU35300.1 hypothetical protein SAMN05443572_110242 [Myxococcus fulvus]
MEATTVAKAASDDAGTARSSPPFFPESKTDVAALSLARQMQYCHILSPQGCQTSPYYLCQFEEVRR